VTVFPSPFSYVQPSSLPQTLSLLAEYADSAKLLAGGQSLLPLMKLRLAAPEMVIDIGGLDELRGLRVDEAELVVGALTRFCDLERSELVGRECPVLGRVAAMVGDPQVRHRGTLGGTLAHADPASDLPALLLALDASVVVAGERGSRRVTAEDLFEGFMTTALDDDEILTEVRIPLGRKSWSYQKFTRRAQEWAIVAVAAVRDHHDGRVRVAVANAGSTPLRASTVERQLAQGAGFAAAAAHVVDDIHPFADAIATVEHRRAIAVTLVERALAEMDAKEARDG
jgi:aerobic carbon-monoxide dehydrogenase medium subunit